MGKPFTAPILRLVVASALVVLLAGCGRTPAPTAVGTSTPTAVGILDGAVQTTTFDQVKRAVDDLYSRHPSINSFVVQSVTYTPQTRDRVLKICNEGSIATTVAERERQKVLACAPLIFFFYYYGQQTSAPESVGVARQLYWYAMTDKSDDSKKVLTELLRSWGIP